MFFLLLRRSFSRGFRHKLLAIVTIAAGASLAAAMLNISLDVGDKVARQLRQFGANIVLQPQTQLLPSGQEKAAYLKEKDLTKIKMIFWRNNITSFSPFLVGSGQLNQGQKGEKVSVVGSWFKKKLTIPTGEVFTSQLSKTRPWLKIKGRWPNESKTEVAVSDSLAKRFNLKINRPLSLKIKGKTRAFKVVGIFSGAQETNLIYLPLKIMQKDLNLAGKVSQVEVSALTVPDNDLALKYQNDPDSLNAKEWERWYCTAYVDAIAFQLEEAIPAAKAKVVRQLAHSESLILNKIQFFMALLTAAALISAALGISSLMTTSALERAREIGLAKAIGASNNAVITLFLAEAVVLGLIGSVFGYLMGLGFAAFISANVFKMALTVKMLVPPFTVLVAVLVALLGSLAAVRTIVTLNPKEVLHGN